MGKLTINQWDEADRPRERFIKQGAASLSSAELLAILIGSGSTDESAVSLMRRLMADCGNSLVRLGRMEVGELCSYKGMGPAKAVTVLAACELGKRRAAEQPAERLPMSSPEAIVSYYRHSMRDLPVEECHVLLLNQQLRLLDERCISRGGLTETSADIRCILREALLARATAIALCHNHPSGVPRPGEADNRLTDSLKRAAGLLNIRLIDHVIVAGETYYSYADEGRI